MPSRELLFVSGIVEASRLYQVLKVFKDAKAANVETRIVELEGGDEPGPKRGGARANAGRPPAGPLREPILQLLTEAGEQGASIRQLIETIGRGRKSNIYAVTYALLKEGKITRPEPGRYVIAPNGSGEPVAAAPVGATAAQGIGGTKIGQVLALFNAQDRVTTTDIRKLCGSKNTADGTLKKLIARKLVRRVEYGVYERVNP